MLPLTRSLHHLRHQGILAGALRGTGAGCVARRWSRTYGNRAVPREDKVQTGEWSKLRRMTRQPSLFSHVSHAHVVSITMRGGGGTPLCRQEHSASPRFIYFMPPRQHGDFATTASGPCRCLHHILGPPYTQHYCIFRSVATGASDTDGIDDDRPTPSEITFRLISSRRIFRKHLVRIFHGAIPCAIPGWFSRTPLSPSFGQP